MFPFTHNWTSLERRLFFIIYLSASTSLVCCRFWKQTASQQHTLNKCLRQLTTDIFRHLSTAENEKRKRWQRKIEKWVIHFNVVCFWSLKCFVSTICHWSSLLNKLTERRKTPERKNSQYGNDRQLIRHVMLQPIAKVSLHFLSFF